MEYEYTSELNTKAFDASDFDRMMMEFDNRKLSEEKTKNNVADDLGNKKEDYTEPEPVYKSVKSEKSVEVKNQSQEGRTVSHYPELKQKQETEVEIETCQLRDIPKCLVEVAKECFPLQSNYKAVSAFLYAHRPPNSKVNVSSVPKEIKDLAKLYKTDESVKSSDEIKNLNNNIRNILKNNDDMMLALSYLIYDIAGLGIEKPSKPSEIPFYEPGIQLVRSNLERHAKKIREEKNREEGRRNNIYGSAGGYRKDE